MGRQSGILLTCNVRGGARDRRMFEPGQSLDSVNPSGYRWWYNKTSLPYRASWTAPFLSSTGFAGFLQAACDIDLESSSLGPSFCCTKFLLVPVIVKNTFLLREPWPCDTAAQTSILSLICCFKTEFPTCLLLRRSAFFSETQGIQGQCQRWNKRPRTSLQALSVV